MSTTPSWPTRPTPRRPPVARRCWPNWPRLGQAAAEQAAAERAAAALTAAAPATTVAPTTTVAAAGRAARDRAGPTADHRAARDRHRPRRHRFPHSPPVNTEEGTATWYRQPLRYAPDGCAHKTLPFGTVVTVTNLNTGGSTVLHRERSRPVRRRPHHRPRRRRLRPAGPAQRRPDVRSSSAGSSAALTGRPLAGDPHPSRRRRSCSARHGIEPSRALGQNFVVDPNTVRRIARLAGVEPGETVVEVGRRPRSRSRSPWPRQAPESPRSSSTATCCPCCRRSLRDIDVRIVEADAMTLDWSTVLIDSPIVDSRGQPALQRRHAARARPARRRSRHHLDAGHGPARGGRAAGRRARSDADLRHPVGQGRLPGDAPRSWAGCRPACSCPNRGRVGAGAHRAPARAGQPRPIPGDSSGWCGRRSASDARCCAARWRGPSSPRRFATAGVPPEPAPRSWPSRRGAGWPTPRHRSTDPDSDADAGGPGPRQAHALAARHRSSAPTATTSSTPRW